MSKIIEFYTKIVYNISIGLDYQLKNERQVIMKRIKGTSISKGIAFGYIHFQDIRLPEIEPKITNDTNEEVARFYKACADSFNLLQTFYERTIHIIGVEDAKIFSIQQMLLHDSDYVNTIVEFIEEENYCAEYAVYLAAQKFIDFFLNMDTELMRSKSCDIIDISCHIIQYLTTEHRFKESEDKSNKIIVSNRFIPSQVIKLALAGVEAITVIDGMKKSHASILTRKLEIPSIINTPSFDKESEGKYAAVDGFAGEIIIEPDEETIEKLKTLQNRYLRIKKAINNTVSKRLLAKKNHGVKLIALDLDGTIISNSTKISEKCIDAINTVADKGVIIAICTGRVMGEIPEKIKNLKSVKYFITSGGSSIVTNLSDSIYSNTIDYDIANKIFEILNEYKCLIDLYIDGQGYMQYSDLKKLDFYNVNDGFEQILYTSRCMKDDIMEYYNANKPRLEKINLFFADKKERREAIYRISKLNPAPKLAHSMEYNLEITSSTACKGQALQHLCHLTGVDMSEVMAMGDSNNDISMLKLAGISVAMGNASESVRNIAKYITDTCENNGAAKAIINYAMK